ncbi:MAG: tetratricopeptide repeat protein [Candidatus Omnitrophota bacterium]|nr:tetratricopeptide repeat protein [Candidatus Omnitrophota bacterium]
MGESSKVTKPDKAQVWIIAALALVGLLIYSNTLRSPFVFDDNTFITHNSRIQDLSNVSAIWEDRSRFLPMLSFAVNFHFAKTSVWPYHLTNIVIHILASVVGFFLVLITFQTPAMRGHPLQTRGAVIAAFAGFIFLCHPLQTQAVAYITQRMASMVCLFYLATVYFYAKARLSGRWGYYVIAVVFTFCAVFSKQNAFTLPGALILYEICFFRNSGGIAGAATRVWPFFLPPAVAFASFLVRGSDVASTMRMLTPISRSHYFFTELNVVRTYIRLLFFPVGQTLDHDYPITTTLADPVTLLSMAFLAGWIYLAVKIFKKHLLVSFGIFWFFVTLSVESSFIPINDVIFEHRVYLPMFGFAVAVSAYGAQMIKNRARLRTAGIVLLVLLSMVTFTRNFVWSHPVRLWTDVVRKSPNTPRGHYNLGLSLLDVNKVDLAKQHFERAIKIHEAKGMPEVWYNAPIYFQLGRANRKLGGIEAAVRAFANAVELDPDFAVAHFHLGQSYYLAEEYDKSVECIERALALNPDRTRPYDRAVPDLSLARFHLAQARHAAGDHDGEMEAYRESLSSGGGDTSVRVFFARALAKDGRYEEALEQFNLIVEATGDAAEYFRDLGRIYRELGQGDKEIDLYQAVAEKKPDDPVSYESLGRVLAQQKRFDESAVEFGRAIDLRNERGDVSRELAFTLYNLGQVRHQTGDLNGEFEAYQRALEIYPNYDKAHGSLGDSLFDAEKYEEAIRAYAKVIELASVFGNPYFKTGFAYTQLGDWVKALKYYELALEKEPEPRHPLFHSLTGQAYLENGRLDEAAHHMEIAVDRLPNEVIPRYNLAIIYVQQAKLDLAAEQAGHLDRLNQPKLAQRIRDLSGTFATRRAEEETIATS